MRYFVYHGGRKLKTFKDETVAIAFIGDHLLDYGVLILRNSDGYFEQFTVGMM